MHLIGTGHRHAIAIPSSHRGCYNTTSHSRGLILLLTFEPYRCWFLEENNIWFGGVEGQPVAIAMVVIASEEENRGLIVHNIMESLFIREPASRTIDVFAGMLSTM